VFNEDFEHLRVDHFAQGTVTVTEIAVDRCGLDRNLVIMNLSD